MPNDFSDQWKTPKLVLIPKGKSDPSLLSAYRPLILLNTTGKLYEHLLRLRLTEVIRNGEDSRTRSSDLGEYDQRLGLFRRWLTSSKAQTDIATLHILSCC